MPKNFLSHAKIAQFSALFSEFDYYSTGSIHVNSMREILVSLLIDIKEEDVLSILADTGNTNPTMVGLDQFLAIMCVITEDKDLTKEVENVFNIFDIDKSKQVNRDDIKRALEALDLEFDEKEIMEMLNSNKRQSLSLQEFEEYMFRNL